ncbi:MAG: aconitate hydratase AcnA [SAR202 cluster bacterium]|nr:aconitate hydratase AcnA [SAR202 cluster bacterium]|tara:strand:- start:272 stop:2926 length:2655 start_codon:yes stop_codon:yes gene_type:complete
MRFVDKFNIKDSIETSSGDYYFCSLEKLAESNPDIGIDKMPNAVKIMVESVIRNTSLDINENFDINKLKLWNDFDNSEEVPYFPSRVLLQDFTGVPTIVDLASMRDAMLTNNGDPSKVNPMVPVDLVIDHSVQVDYFGTKNAFMNNVNKEYERNNERYSLLKWAQNSFDNVKVVPPGAGIVHQVNLEFLSPVISVRNYDNISLVIPDTLIGTDSHTPMVSGLGVLAWGVGGIEAESVMVGQPVYMKIPSVIGVNLTGKLSAKATATDLVLSITQKLRSYGVVGKMVEFYGESLNSLSLPDRATISNMAPEYGATASLFPVDSKTLDYLELTGRTNDQINLIEQYSKSQGLFRSNQDTREYNSTITINLDEIEPSMAGPKRPQDKVKLSEVKSNFNTFLADTGQSIVNSNELDHGSVVIAAITSCTNTSNPDVMVGAGILARNAVRKGLNSRPWVKTSLAPGSQVVDDYLLKAGLIDPLEKLGFHIVGHGCTTCIGNSGPLPEKVSNKINDENLVTCAVLSGNRNFEARVHQQVKANYLASPILVVAYAIAGTLNINFDTDPIGIGQNGEEVFLEDIWPEKEEIHSIVNHSLNPSMFKDRYGKVFEGDDNWKDLSIPDGNIYKWDKSSTYIQPLSIFNDFKKELPEMPEINKARILAVLGDSITTDHISPAGNISKDSPASEFLEMNDISPIDFNTYGARRGNENILVRGTFANIRLRNLLTSDKEGGYTIHFPSNEVMSIYEASEKYKEDNTPLVIIAGDEYGSGSSRDWAAKGPYLLGVKLVIAKSFERIHRSNLIGMGILPVEFVNGEDFNLLKMNGDAILSIENIEDVKTPSSLFQMTVKNPDSKDIKKITLKSRIDTNAEVNYYVNGGLLQFVLRKLLND